MLDDAKVVRDEEIGEPELLLQVLQQIDDLRLDRDVERRDRFVADDELGTEGQRAGDADPLPLPAAELVRIAVRDIPCASPTMSRSCMTRRWRAALFPMRWMMSGSSRMSRTVMRGFREEKGFWKMIWIDAPDGSQLAI